MHKQDPFQKRRNLIVVFMLVGLMVAMVGFCVPYVMSGGHAGHMHH